MSRIGKAFVFTPELCIQCHACESACKNWRQTEDFVRWRRVTAIESGTFPDTKVTYRSVSCLHCEEPACMEVCPVKAISKTEEGIVLVDEERCIGCRLCSRACPVDAPVFGVSGKMQKCDLCVNIEPKEQQAPCVRMCPTGALRRGPLGTEFSGFFHVPSGV